MIHLKNPQLRIAILCAGVAVFAWMAGSTPAAVTAFGFPLPVFCIFRTVTHLDCPGCGLTRALVFAAHGNYLLSYNLHLWGIPLWFLILAQIPYRAGLYFFRKDSVFTVPPNIRRWISHFVILSLLLPWAAKTVIWFVLRYC